MCGKLWGLDRPITEIIGFKTSAEKKWKISNRQRNLFIPCFSSENCSQHLSQVSKCPWDQINLSIYVCFRLFASIIFIWTYILINVLNKLLQTITLICILCHNIQNLSFCLFMLMYHISLIYIMLYFPLYSNKLFVYVNVPLIFDCRPCGRQIVFTHLFLYISFFSFLIFLFYILISNTPFLCYEPLISYCQINERDLFRFPFLLFLICRNNFVLKCYLSTSYLWLRVIWKALVHVNIFIFIFPFLCFHIWTNCPFT